MKRLSFLRDVGRLYRGNGPNGPVCQRQPLPYIIVMPATRPGMHTTQV